jgi:LysR family transcriptional activator of nhaA
LHLTPQTVSSQIRDLEEGLGEQLFFRQGRRLVITDVGHLVFKYAEQIFGLGEELQEALRALPSSRPIRFSVGVVDVVPKLVAHRLIQPINQMDVTVQFVCHEGNLEELLVELSLHNLDVVLSDSPIPRSVKIKAYNHKLGECDVIFVANRDLAGALRDEFPESLKGAPFLLPVKGTRLRQELDTWFDARSNHPAIVGEFDDSALLKVFGQGGTGFFAVPSVILAEVERQYQVEMIGPAEGIVESFYAISGERQIQHPAVEAICRMSRSQLFDSFPPAKPNAKPGGS